MKQNKFLYRIIRFLAWFLAIFVFKRKFLRNEIKGKKGPFVIIANHQSQLDFVNLMGATSTPLNFVISKSFYDTLPCERIVSRLGLIPKQQFQTSLKDLHRMKEVIESGNVLVIYPAGLMCEDGRSTPIPTATYEFIKWLKADVYVAKTSGTYFLMPKWSKGIRKGRTYLDIYKMYSKDELEDTTVDEIKDVMERELEFDAYQMQEKMLVRYHKNSNIEGLENVLYMCPECGREFTIRVKNKNVIYCECCGFEEKCDKYGFLHRTDKKGKEFRYVSDWSCFVHDEVSKKIRSGELTTLSTHATISMINPKRRKFEQVGDAQITLCKDCFNIKGLINGEEVELRIPTATFASLPFKPGKCFEIQHGTDIFRCYPDDGQIVMKIVNMVKVFYEVNCEQIEHTRHDRHKDADCHN